MEIDKQLEQIAREDRERWLRLGYKLGKEAKTRYERKQERQQEERKGLRSRKIELMKQARW